MLIGITVQEEQILHRINKNSEKKRVALNNGSYVPKIVDARTTIYKGKKTAERQDSEYHKLDKMIQDDYAELRKVRNERIFGKGKSVQERQMKSYRE